MKLCILLEPSNDFCKVMVVVIRLYLIVCASFCAQNVDHPSMSWWGGAEIMWDCGTAVGPDPLKIE